MSRTAANAAIGRTSGGARKRSCGAKSWGKEGHTSGVSSVLLERVQMLAAGGEERITTACTMSTNVAVLT